jgi:hypothetical protein
MPSLPHFQPQGRDSVVGSSVLLNPRAIAVHRALVQISGTTFRNRPSVLLELMEQVAVLDRAGLGNALTKPALIGFRGGGEFVTQPGRR